jgi:hypothetical protein
MNAESSTRFCSKSEGNCDTPIVIVALTVTSTMPLHCFYSGCYSRNIIQVDSHSNLDLLVFPLYVLIATCKVTSNFLIQVSQSKFIFMKIITPRPPPPASPSAARVTEPSPLLPCACWPGTPLFRGGPRGRFRPAHLWLVQLDSTPPGLKWIVLESILYKSKFISNHFNPSQST